jgi:hypothetical protein
MKLAFVSFIDQALLDVGACLDLEADHTALVAPADLDGVTTRIDRDRSNERRRDAEAFAVDADLTTGRLAHDLQ